MSQLFTVLTFKHTSFTLDELLPSVTDYLTALFPLKLILVKETGKNGDNPHLNIVIELASKKRTDVLTKAMHTIYTIYDSEYDPTPYDVKTKKAYNIPNLISGYLAKESDFEILLNHNYNLEELKELVIKMPSKSHRLNVMRLVDAHTDIYNFSEINRIPISSRTTFASCIKIMIQNNYSFLPIFGKLNHIYAHYSAQYLGGSYFDELIDEILKLKSESIT